MMVREICKEQYTEKVFQTFDYFNDFTDTSNFVRFMIEDAKTPGDKGRFENILKRLEEGNEAFVKAFWAKRNLND